MQWPLLILNASSVSSARKRHQLTFNNRRFSSASANCLSITSYDAHAFSGQLAQSGCYNELTIQLQNSTYERDADLQEASAGHALDHNGVLSNKQLRNIEIGHAASACL